MEHLKYTDIKESPAHHTALLMVLRNGGHEYVAPEAVKTYEQQGYTLCSDPEVLEDCFDKDSEEL